MEKNSIKMDQTNYKIKKEHKLYISNNSFFGMPYTPLNYMRAVEVLFSFSEMFSRKIVYTPNVHHFHLYRKNEKFREAYDNADVSLLDGMPLVWACSIQNKYRLEKISGADIFKTILAICAEKKAKIFLLGAAPGVAAKAIKNIKLEHEMGYTIFTHAPSINFSQYENDHIREMINDIRPNFLFVAFGAPKQEIWLLENRDRLDFGVGMGVGGTFDFYAGKQKRAPIWMQNSGLEWFYRLVHDPKRLFLRYFKTNFYFIPFLCATLGMSIINSRKLHFKYLDKHLRRS